MLNMLSLDCLLSMGSRLRGNDVLTIAHRMPLHPSDIPRAAAWQGRIKRFLDSTAFRPRTA
jgi:hypothetical protein